MRLVLATVLGFMSVQATAGDFLPVCERTQAVREFLEGEAHKACAYITPEDLVAIKRVAVPDMDITEFKALDFSGLPNLEILNIKGNPITTIPEGLTKDLPYLKVLVVFRTDLTSLPEDFLEGNTEMEDLHIFANPFKTLPKSFLERLKTYPNWTNLDFNKALNKEEKDILTGIFASNTRVALNFY